MRHTLAQAAHLYAERAWRIFPLKPRTKEPLTEHGFHDSTSAVDAIERWWGESPEANIGLHPGPSGFVVIDVDGPEGREAAMALGLLSQPTLTAVTPRGWHLYFRHPGGHIGNTPLAPHVDVRADEGYVLVPPSVHPSGAVYRWVKDDTLELAPEVAVRLNGNGHRPAAPLPPGAPIPDGQRNTTLTSLAGTMRRRGMEAGEIAAALHAVNTARCQPPLDEEEVERIALSVCRYAPADRVPDPVPPGEDEPQGEEDGAELTARTGTDGSAQVFDPPPHARSRSLAEILANPDAAKPPQAVVPGLAWAGRITLLSAGEGVGKSTLLGAAAAAVTSGGEFLGERCAQGTVLWVLLEEHVNDLVLRALRFQTGKEELWVLERPGEPLASVEAEVDRLMPALVVVDTLHAFAAPLVKDKSQADDWLTVMAALDRIARKTNAAVLLAAQAQRSTGDYRDSGSIGHGVDVVLNLVRPDKESPVRRLETRKARWELPDLPLELVGDTYRRGGVVAKKLSKQRQRVLDALEPPMSYTEWQEASGVPETTFKRTLKYLTTQGYIARAADETYTLKEGPKGPNGGHGRSGPESREGPPLAHTESVCSGPSDGPPEMAPDDVEERYDL